MDEVMNARWIRKHDLAGTDLAAPTIFYPRSLDDLIEICSDPDRRRLKAAGSHWALSTAAISDGDFIETNDPRNVHPAMGRTLYDVVPGCLHEDYLSDMARRHPAAFGDPPDAPPPVDHAATYLVHVETGKRIYQLYAELDNGDDGNMDQPCGPDPQRTGSLAVPRRRALQQGLPRAVGVPDAGRRGRPDRLRRTDDRNARRRFQHRARRRGRRRAAPRRRRRRALLDRAR